MEIKKRHLIEYSLIFIVSVAFLIMFVFFRANKEMLKLLSAIISFAYILWGTVHSAIEGRLNKLVVLEYILFGVLVFLIFFFALSF
jgi:hypothetical protein